MDWMKSERGRAILRIMVAGWCFSGLLASDQTGTVDPRGETAVASHVDFTSSNLPIMIIDTRGQTIPDARKIPADMGIIDNGRGNRNSVTDPWNGYDGRIGIELRGSTAQQFAKRPYGFETRDSLGNNFNTSLLGMPKENDWVLYNPFTDKTMMRDVLSYKISNDIGRYASRTRLIELVLNGNYQGVYVLLEKLKQDKNRVDISKMDSTDVKGDTLTGGYIIKIDKTTGESRGGWSSSHRIYYQYHYPKPDLITSEQKAYIKGAVDAFEKALDNPDGTDPEAGYRKVLSLDAFVDNVILSEVNRNVDAYRLSMFLYKDRDSKDGKFHAGPIWDCNLTFGNVNYHEAWKTEGWNLDALVASPEGSGVPYWWMKIRKDPTFLSRLRERWNEFRKDALNADSLVQFIDATADTLGEAQERNFRRYPILGSYVWPNYFIWQSFEEEVEFLKEWLQNRIDWLDGEFNGTGAVVSEKAEAGIPRVCRLEQNYPNPFNASTQIRFALPNTGRVTLKVYDILGKEVAILADGVFSAGRHEATFWTGSLSSGIYFYRLETPGFSRTRKLILAK